MSLPQSPPCSYCGAETSPHGEEFRYLTDGVWHHKGCGSPDRYKPTVPSEALGRTLGPITMDWERAGRQAEADRWVSDHIEAVHDDIRAGDERTHFFPDRGSSPELSDGTPPSTGSLEPTSVGPGASPVASRSAVEVGYVLPGGASHPEVGPVDYTLPVGMTYEEFTARSGRGVDPLDPCTLSPTPQQSTAPPTSEAAALGGGVGDSPACAACGGTLQPYGSTCVCDSSPDPASSGSVTSSHGGAGSGDSWDAALAGAELEQLVGRLRALAEAVDDPGSVVSGRTMAGLIRMAMGGGE